MARSDPFVVRVGGETQPRCNDLTSSGGGTPTDHRSPCDRMLPGASEMTKA